MPWREFKGLINNPLQERDCLGNIGRLASRQNEANRQTQRIGQRMDLATKAAA
ncbi:hypothetical protein GCM10027398_32780 [Azotobacter salinestris]